jgi:hypothetical protein
MQASAWIQLIERIPAAYHESLVAVTSTGAEIMVQRIMRLEEQFVILRGRPAGSTDQPRILLLPWDQLNHLAFHKALPEPEIQKIFGGGDAAVAPAPVTEAPANQPAAEQPVSAPSDAVTTEVPKGPPPPAVPPTPAPEKLSKSVLLARLRARMANELSKG